MYLIKEPVWKWPRFDLRWKKKKKIRFVLIRLSKQNNQRRTVELLILNI